MKVNSMFAYAMVWLSVALAVCVALYVTGSFNCLWFLLVPLAVSCKSST